MIGVLSTYIEKKNATGMVKYLFIHLSNMVQCNVRTYLFHDIECTSTVSTTFVHIIEKK